MSTAPLCVLVADDNRDTADTSALLVTLWGHRPIVAYDGESAVTAARLHRPDAVLLDIEMPGLDGCEVARLLRADAGLLVAVTGHAREEDRRRCLEAGFHHFLVKPVEPDIVCSLLLEVQRAKALGAQTQELRRQRAELSGELREAVDELRQRRQKSEEARAKQGPDGPSQPLP